MLNEQNRQRRRWNGGTQVEKRGQGQGEGQAHGERGRERGNLVLEQVGHGALRLVERRLELLLRQPQLLLLDRQRRLVLAAFRCTAHASALLFGSTRSWRLLIVSVLILIGTS